MKKLIVLTLAVMFNVMTFAQSSIGKWLGKSFQNLL